MAEALKDLFNRENIGALATDISSVSQLFQEADFINTIFDQDWEERSLKEREQHLTRTLGAFLSNSYPEALQVLRQVGPRHEGFIATALSGFVSEYGLDAEFFDLSVTALKEFTKSCTSEFAVRPFIENYEEKMLALMLEWASDECEHVRRLASEGCRPALPWGKALVKYKQDPTPILPILERLKDDNSKYVQKSVANNLNDISKTHPDLILELANKWLGTSNNTDWIVKHALRTLLKSGHVEALKLFGYEDARSVTVTPVTVSKNRLTIGDCLTFSFEIQSDVDTLARLEYAVDFVKANGKTSRKVFKISETKLMAGKEKSYEKRHGFKDLTTRKHYPGIHTITVLVNGIPRESESFELLRP